MRDDEFRGRPDDSATSWHALWLYIAWMLSPLAILAVVLATGLLLMVITGR